MVKGHTCPGLERFQARTDEFGEPHPRSTCIPVFGEDGTCMGCDDTNYVAILYCPFCGVSLD